MPIYEYTCKACHKAFEQLVRTMGAAERVKCPECGSARTARSLSVFAVASNTTRTAPAPPPGICGHCNGPGPCAIE